MNFKRTTLGLLLAACFFPVAHAADTMATDTVIAAKTAAPVSDKQAVLVDASNVRDAGKSREQVIAEVVQAKKDGSYVALPEAYPESFYFRTAR
jgi:hypothetical protein